ncbi:MAG: TlpA disulfide reductase family protein [Bacteroidota bacterium]
MKMISPLRYCCLGCLLFVCLIAGGQVVYDQTPSPVSLSELAETLGDSRAEIRDKHLILEFWATWCRPCVTAIPHINALATQYREDIAFVSVNSYDSEAVVQDFLTQREMKSVVHVDTEQHLKTAFDVHLIPQAIIIDQQGNLRWRGLARDLTEAILDTFLLENRILTPPTSEYLLNEVWEITDTPTEEPVYLQTTLESYTYSHLRESVTSVAYEFEDGFEVELLNFPFNSMIDWIYYFAHESNDQLTFEGSPPIDKNLNFVASSNTAADEKLLLSHIFQQLKNEYSFEVDSTRIQQAYGILELTEPTKLDRWVSEDQTAEAGTENQAGEYLSCQQMTLERFCLYLGSILDLEVRYLGSDSTKYSLRVKLTEDWDEMKIYLQENFGLTLHQESETVQAVTITYPE